MSDTSLNFPEITRRCRWLVLVLGWILIPVLAQAQEFEPASSGSLPATIPTTVGGSITNQITVSGVTSSIAAVRALVWITCSNPGDLVVLLSAPNGQTIVLACEDGTTNNSSAIQNTCTFNGGLGGGGQINSQVTQPGGFGTGREDGQMVEFDSASTNPIDQFRGVNSEFIIPAGDYEPASQSGAFFAISNINPPGGYANNLVGGHRGIGLDQFRGMADFNVNGTWTLSVYNFDPDVADNTGTISWWALQIDQVGPHIWTGADSQTDTNFSDAGNWNPSAGAPQTWEQKTVLVFPNSAGAYDPINDLSPLTVGALTLDGTYSITGQPMILTGNAVITNEGSTSNVANALTLTYPNQALQAPNSTLAATGPTVYVLQGELILSGAISGGGGTFGAFPANANLNTYGPSPLVLTGVNSFPGEVDVNTGILELANGSAVTGSLLRVAAGASAWLGATGVTKTDLTPAPTSPTPWPYNGGSGTVSVPMDLAGMGIDSQGALKNITASSITITSTIDLESTNTGIGAVPGSSLNFATAGQFSGDNLYFTGVKPGGAGGTLNLNTTLNLGLLLDGGTAVLGGNLTSVATLSVLDGAAVTVAGLNVQRSLSSTPLGLANSPNTISGPLSLTSGGFVFTVLAGPGATPDLILSGSLSAPAGFVMKGGGYLVDNDVPGGGALPAATVLAGDFGGTGTIGNLTVSAGAMVEPGFNAAGTLTVGNLVLASGAFFTADLSGGASLTSTGATIKLGGALNGSTGAYLRPVGGGAGGPYTIINYTAGALSSAFFGRPNNTATGINYDANGNSAVQLTLDGSTIGLRSATYTFSKGAGSQLIPVTWVLGTGPTPSSLLLGEGTTAIVQQDFMEPTPAPLLESQGSNFTLHIVQNYISEGNTQFNLLLVPLGETTIAPHAQATVTIIDNQNQGTTKKCGFGSGLTVFFLGSLVLFACLRSRRR